MSYKALKEEDLVLTKQPSNCQVSATKEYRLPRHSISISLVLAVISYCCCAGLGIIPLIMVVFAYVKRETGKHEDAKRLSKYSRIASTILIVLSIILTILAVTYCITTTIYSMRMERAMLQSYGDDMVYPPNDRMDYYKRAYNTYGEPPIEYEYYNTDDETDGENQDSTEEYEN